MSTNLCFFSPPLPLKSDLSNNGVDEASISSKPEAVTAFGAGSGSSGSRAGLFRTPISGGVQSATSAHDLPPPALAVRNLMEQVIATCILA